MIPVSAGIPACRLFVVHMALIAEPGSGRSRTQTPSAIGTIENPVVQEDAGGGALAA